MNATGAVMIDYLRGVRKVKKKRLKLSEDVGNEL